MDARERHHLVSVSARPPSWPLVGWSCPRPAKGLNAASPADLHHDVAAIAPDPVVKYGAYQALATAAMLMASNCAASTAQIQFP